MKVILLRDVAKLGKRFSIVVVPDGYALNKLIPQGIAEAASAENLKRVNARSDKQTADRSNEQTEFKATLAALKDIQVPLAAEANAQEHLFKAVKASDIAVALAALGYALPLETIHVAEPIKALGTHTITAKLGEVSGSFTLCVISK